MRERRKRILGIEVCDFRDLPIERIDELGFKRFLANDYRCELLDIASRRVMDIRVIDLFLFVLWPIKLMFLPLASWLEWKDIQRLLGQGTAAEYFTMQTYRWVGAGTGWAYR